MPKQIRHWMGLVWKKCPLSSVRSPWYNTNITSASICSSQSTIESTVWTLNHDKVMTKFKRTYVLSAECFYRKDLDFFHFWRSHTFSLHLRLHLVKTYLNVLMSRSEVWHFLFCFDMIWVMTQNLSLFQPKFLSRNSRKRLCYKQGATKVSFSDGIMFSQLLRMAAN